METYLVGGAVRDRLLELPVTERDWVVVGASADEMRAHGFKPVGKDFPVFLHPETGEEYALARTERKSGRGYYGFDVNASPDVTLEADLQRRDLTINAIAEAPDGALIDPYGGRADLEARVLRHVSAAFEEDPLRVLRAARFAARFAALGFTIAPETLALMRRMAESGELDTLTPERVWQETRRALTSDAPRVYFQTLRDCGALAAVFPEVDALFGVPQPPKHHPEIDAGLHTLMVVEQAAKLTDDTAVRFAALVHDLGKADTPADVLPSHHGHEARGVARVEALCERLRAPRALRDLGVVVARWHLHCHRARELRPETLLKLFEGVDAFRRPARFEQFLLTCEADARGRAGLEDREYPQPVYLRGALKVAQAVDARELAEEGFKGAALGEELRKLRCEAIAAFKTNSIKPI
ncbi:MAG TPA: multifunctional CCA addition/repair protein [Gammaproteobacteria bacterium]|nr:multifunctional CCA addition/repair protein [Gammaproteobacteria bacterium]